MFCYFTEETKEGRVIMMTLKKEENRELVISGGTRKMADDGKP